MPVETISGKHIELSASVGKERYGSTVQNGADLYCRHCGENLGKQIEVEGNNTPGGNGAARGTKIKISCDTCGQSFIHTAEYDTREKTKNAVQNGEPRWLHPVESSYKYMYAGYEIWIAKNKKDKGYYWVALDGAGGSEDGDAESESKALSAARYMVEAFVRESKARR